VITGLIPDTGYSYSVDGDGATDTGTFTTAPTNPLTPFVFIAVGDNRSIHADHQSVVDAIDLNEADADFLMNTGDMVSSGEVAADWQFYFDIEYALIKELPWFPTVGNHEEDNGALPIFFSDYLAPPTDTSGTETYYSFTYANSAFIVLDGHVDIVPLIGDFSTTQKTWLVGQLSQYQTDPTIQHIFVFVHEPPYSSVATRSGNYHLRVLLLNEFVTYGIDAVISGHDHYLERGESPDQIPYFTMGGGGAPLYTNESEGNLGYKPATIAGLFNDDHTVNFALSAHGYMRVEVNNGQVDAYIKDLSGGVLDTMSWNTGDIIPGPDGGVADAGVPDAGAPDAAAPDAAAPADAATQADAAPPGPDSGGTPPAGDDGCGCRQGAGSAPVAWLLPLLGLVLLWRRRRRRCRRRRRTA
jgi:MYXO-CTERM domain-containing protein